MSEGQRNTPAGIAHKPGWNDPPKTVFKAGSRGTSTTSLNGKDSPVNGDANSDAADSPIAVNGEPSSSDFDTLASILETCLVSCRDGVSKNGTPIQKKMMDDTAKRLDVLLDKLKAKDDAISKCLAHLKSFLDAITIKDYTASTRTATELMTSDFSSDSDSTKWILGLKRLTELMKATDS